MYSSSTSLLFPLARILAVGTMPRTAAFVPSSTTITNSNRQQQQQQQQRLYETNGGGDTIVSPFDDSGAATESSSSSATTTTTTTTATSDYLELTWDNVEAVLDEMRPYLIQDGGNVVIQEIDGPVVRLELQVCRNECLFVFSLCKKSRCHCVLLT